MQVSIVLVYTCSYYKYVCMYVCIMDVCMYVYTCMCRNIMDVAHSLRKTREILEY